METLTHLKKSVDFVREENKSFSQLVVSKFIGSCSQLDASIVEPYMSEDYICRGGVFTA